MTYEQVTTELVEAKFLHVGMNSEKNGGRRFQGAEEAFSVALNMFDSFPITIESTLLTFSLTSNCTFCTCLSVGNHIKNCNADFLHYCYFINTIFKTLHIENKLVVITNGERGRGRGNIGIIV